MKDRRGMVVLAVGTYLCIYNWGNKGGEVNLLLLEVKHRLGFGDLFPRMTQPKVGEINASVLRLYLPDRPLLLCDRVILPRPVVPGLAALGAVGADVAVGAARLHAQARRVDPLRDGLALDVVADEVVRLDHHVYDQVDGLVEVHGRADQQLGRALERHDVARCADHAVGAIYDPLAGQVVAEPVPTAARGELVVVEPERCVVPPVIAALADADDVPKPAARRPGVVPAGYDVAVRVVGAEEVEEGSVQVAHYAPDLRVPHGVGLKDQDGRGSFQEHVLPDLLVVFKDCGSDSDKT